MAKKNANEMAGSLGFLRALSAPPKAEKVGPAPDTASVALPLALAIALPITPAIPIPPDSSGPSSIEEHAGYVPFRDGAQYRPGDHVLLPVTRLKENPRNPRVFFTEDKSNSLVQSLAAEGQLSAAQAYPADSDGFFRLKSGHRRRRALMVLRHEFMKVEIVSESANVLEEYRQARALNLEHRTHSHFDDAVRFRELLGAGEASDQKSLSFLLSVPEAEMSKCLAISELPGPVLEYMAENVAQFGLTASYYVYQYWKFSGRSDEHTMKLAMRVTEGGLSVRALESIVKENNKGSGAENKKRERTLSRAILSGPAKGELKTFDDRVLVKIEGLSPAMRDDLFQRMVTLFKEAGLHTQSGALNLPTTSPSTEGVG